MSSLFCYPRHTLHRLLNSYFPAFSPIPYIISEFATFNDSTQSHQSPQQLKVALSGTARCNTIQVVITLFNAKHGIINFASQVPSYRCRRTGMIPTHSLIDTIKTDYNEPYSLLPLGVAFTLSDLETQVVDYEMKVTLVSASSQSEIMENSSRTPCRKK